MYFYIREWVGYEYLSSPKVRKELGLDCQQKQIQHNNNQKERRMRDDQDSDGEILSEQLLDMPYHHVEGDDLEMSQEFHSIFNDLKAYIAFYIIGDAVMGCVAYVMHIQQCSGSTMDKLDLWNEQWMFYFFSKSFYHFLMFLQLFSSSCKLDVCEKLGELRAPAENALHQEELENNFNDSQRQQMHKQLEKQCQGYYYQRNTLLKCFYHLKSLVTFGFVLYGIVVFFQGDYFSAWMTNNTGPNSVSSCTYTLTWWVYISVIFVIASNREVFDIIFIIVISKDTSSFIQFIYIFLNQIISLSKIIILYFLEKTSLNIIIENLLFLGYIEQKTFFLLSRNQFEALHSTSCIFRYSNLFLILKVIPIILFIYIPIVVYKSCQQQRKRKQLFKNFKSVKYSVGKVKGDTECTICRMDYIIDDQIICLPCNELHHFHKDCIMSWLKINLTCPLCRYNFGEDPELQQQQNQVDPPQAQVQENDVEEDNAVQINIGDINQQPSVNGMGGQNNYVNMHLDQNGIDNQQQGQQQLFYQYMDQENQTEDNKDQVFLDYRGIVELCSLFEKEQQLRIFMEDNEYSLEQKQQIIDIFYQTKNKRI